MTYSARINEMNETIAANGAPWGAIDAQSAARMIVQNRFRTGLDIARYTARIMREDMDAFDGFLSHAWAVTVTGAPKLWAMRPPLVMIPAPCPRRARMPPKSPDRLRRICAMVRRWCGFWRGWTQRPQRAG